MVALVWPKIKAAYSEKVNRGSSGRVRERVPGIIEYFVNVTSSKTREPRDWNGNESHARED